MELFLVDGTFEIFRCFRAAESVQTTTGQEVGAARAFFHTMVSLLREERLTHVAVAFDSVVSRISPGDQSESALRRSQFPIAADIARALGMTIWPMSRFQADDAIATAAFRFERELDRVVICSNDNDFAQCVRSDRVVRLNRINKEVWNEGSVVQKFGIRPEQIPEYSALVGDLSDGIPGLPGFGPKAAATLLTRYGRLEDIPRTSLEWDVAIRGAARLSEVLEERRNEALLYRNLSTLRTDVPLPETLSELLWEGAFRSRVEAVVEFLEDAALLERTIRYR